MSNYGIPKPPSAPARLAVRVSVGVLPKGTVRERYRREFLAELYGMGGAAQLRHALGLLSAAYALRAAVDPESQPAISELIMPKPYRRAPLLCRLHIHHKWQRAFNPDGEDYLHCAACDKDRYDIERVDPQVGGFGGGMGSLT